MLHMRKKESHFGLSLSRYKLFKAMMSVSILVFLICTLLGLFFFNKLSVELKENFLDLNEYLGSSIQNQFQNSLNYSTTIILDPSNQNIIQSKYDSDELYNLSFRLSSFTSSSPIVNSIFIYYPELDLVVSSIGVFSLKQFFLIKYGFSKKDSFDKWINDLMENKGSFNLDPILENKILYSRFNSSRESVPNSELIVFDFDLGGLSINDNRAFIDELAFYVDGKLIFGKSSTEGKIINHLNKYPEAFSKSDIQKGSDGFIYIYPFMFKNLYLITSMNISSYKNGMLYIILASVFTVLISFFVSIMYSLRKSEKLFQPFRDIAAKLSSNKFPKDPIKIINDKIDNLLETDSFKDERIKEQYEHLQTMLLLDLVKSNYSEMKINKMLKKYDIVFSYSSFYIFVSTDEVVNVFLHELKDKLFNNIACQLFLVEEANMSIGFINIEDEQNVQSDIINSLNSMLILYSIDSTNISLKLSDLCISLSDIYFGYLQCIYLVEKAKGLEFYEDNTKYILKDLKISFEEDDIKLYEFCINKIFNNEKYMPYFLLVNLVEEIRQYVPDFGLEMNINDRISKDIFSNLVKGKRVVSDSQRTLVNKIDKIINRSFRDDSLGLYSISDELKVSNTYLSTVYKESSGCGIVQRINQKRVEYAKELLLTSNKSVKEVALSAGFTSDISFIRVFKKLEDLTPGKLRKNNRLN